MTADGQDAPQKPAAQFSEALHYYFGVGNELYEAKARGDTGEMTDAMQSLVDSLRATLLKTADKSVAGKQLRSAIYEEQRAERFALWFRKAANKLKATKPGLLILELLGSAGVVLVAIDYYVIRVGAGMALLLGFLIIALRLSLPWIVNRIALYEERGLRKLRKIEGD
jgi:hypothetical protein